MSETPFPIDELVSLVTASEKYSHISPHLIRSISIRELKKYPKMKDALKSTRSKLHQIGSAFQEKQIPYDSWEKLLKKLPSDLHSPESLQFLNSCLKYHSSTNERLSIQKYFFEKTLAPIAPVESILDLACGLNPLSLSWIPVKENVSYIACDIYSDMIELLNLFFSHFSINGNATVLDLTATIPQVKTQVAFLLKTIPCLEQIDKSIGQKLFQEIQADNILVSFPSKSLSGKSKGMSANYEKHFLDLIAGNNWKINRHEFGNELAFLIQK